MVATIWTLCWHVDNLDNVVKIDNVDILALLLKDWQSWNVTTISCDTVEAIWYKFKFLTFISWNIPWWDYFICPTLWAQSKQTRFQHIKIFCHIKYDGNQFRYVAQERMQLSSRSKIAHLSLPWSNGWVALSFLIVCPAIVTPGQISTFFNIYRH